MRALPCLSVASAAVVVLLASCGKSNFEFPSSTSSTTATGSGGAQAATSSTGEGGTLSIAAGTTATSSAISGTGGAGGGGCLSESFEGEKKPLDVIVLLDRSVSMAGSPWEGATGALKTFIDDPKNVNTSLGIDFYPKNDLPADCPLTDYNPLQVPLEALPAGAASLVAAIDATQPQGYDTPLHSAVYGALQYATTYQDDHPDHKVALVLASDGGANSCNTKIADIAAAMKTAYDYNGILTFVVAIDAGDEVDFTVLDQLALAGQTGAPIDVTMDNTLLATALEKIRSEVLGCDFAIPAPMGQEFDPFKLNITVTPDGGTAQSIPYLADPTKCNDNEDWYYDDPKYPTKVLLCPAVCELLKNDALAKVDFVFGCPTIDDDMPK